MQIKKIICTSKTYIFALNVKEILEKDGFVFPKDFANLKKELQDIFVHVIDPSFETDKTMKEKLNNIHGNNFGVPRC